MKKYYILIVGFITTGFVFAQGFDNMASSSPDMMTNFREEMTSLMKFQIENNINIPFFINFNLSNRQGDYSDDYLSNVYGDYYSSALKGNQIEDYRQSMEQNVSMGIQFRINQTFYIPIFYFLTFPNRKTLVSSMKIVADDGTVMHLPTSVDTSNEEFYIGTGLIINTDRLKGGIFMGYYDSPGLGGTINGVEYVTGRTNFRFPTNGNTIYNNLPVGTNFDIYDENGNLVYKAKKIHGDVATEYKPSIPFKIAIAPLVKASEWTFIGKALDSIFGYFGIGDAIEYERAEDDSTWSAIASALNLGLDFMFTRIVLDPLKLDTQIIYSRSAYDYVAKNDTYGIKVTGLFTGYPFGFSLEGGYKHFISIAPFFNSQYPNTGYFNGSIYFPFKYLTLSALYQYDAVSNHRFGIVLSNNFLSAHVVSGNNNSDEINEGTSSFGGRFRWGGWNAWKK